MTARTIDRSTVLPASAKAVCELVQTPALLAAVAWPLVRFSPVSPKVFPLRWTPGTYWVRLWLFGLLPFGKQAIEISLPPQDGHLLVVRDNGHSALIRRWDHWIFIDEDAQGCRYRDRVTIDAGWMTLVVWAFASVFYWNRQRRWRHLLTTTGNKELEQ